MESLLTGTELARQIEIEKRATAEGRRRYFAKIDQDAEKGRHIGNVPAQRWLANWAKAMTLAIRKERRRMKTEPYAGGGPGVAHSVLIFGLVSPPKLATIAISEMLNATLGEAGGCYSTNMFMKIGRTAVAEAQLNLWRRQKKSDMFKEIYKKKRNKPSPLDVNRISKKIDDEAIYDTKLCAAVGAKLAWLVVHNCSKNGPGEEFGLAFHNRVNRKSAHRTRGSFYIDEKVRNSIAYDKLALASVKPIYPPMIVPPYAHADQTRGGYVTLPFKLLANSTREQRQIVAERLPKLKHITDSIQNMGSTPVRVNKWILGVIDGLIEQGGGVAGLPFSVDFAIPKKPTDPDAVDKWRLECSRMYRRNIVNQTLFRRMADVTNTAHDFKHEPKLYMNGFVDFRGRWYPRPMYLNHHGGDLERSLIEFSEAKTGERDQYHIAIQCANMFGIDRVSYEKRVEWTKQHLRQIHKAVSDPLNDRWWTEAENPLQFLAACRALFDKDAASRIPIQRDCTSSGFQHYAAMTRDEVAAPLVNLCAGDEPYALYREVAERVAEDIAARYDTPLSRRLLEELPKDDGKLVKQPTMTTVYLVTPFGARKQIRKRLRLERGWSREDALEGARIAAESTLRIVRQLFPRVVAAMDWLVDCATKIASANRLVMWEAPNDFPVLQGYRKKRFSEITTHFHRINLWLDDSQMPVHVKKQANAIAADTVHCVDAAHLYMKGDRCAARGYAYLGVHDCDWTHAATTDEVREIAVNSFADMHLQPYTFRLWEYWTEQHPDIEFDRPPELGTYDPNEARHSLYLTC